MCCVTPSTPSWRRAELNIEIREPGHRPEGGGTQLAFWLASVGLLAFGLVLAIATLPAFALWWLLIGVRPW